MLLTMNSGARKASRRNRSLLLESFVAMVLLSFTALALAAVSASNLKAKLASTHQLQALASAYDNSNSLPPSVAAARKAALLLVSGGRASLACVTSDCLSTISAHIVSRTEIGAVSQRTTSEPIVEPVVSDRVLDNISRVDAAGNSASSKEEEALTQRDLELARKAAAAALDEGESYVRRAVNKSTAFSHDCTAGMCLPSRTDTPVWSDSQLHVWASGATSQASTSAMPGVSQPPRYIVEFLGAEPSGSAGGVHTTAYRITSSGWGTNPATRVGLQTVVNVTY